MGALVPIVLSHEERREYERLCRSGKTSVRLKERLSIILLADEGLNNGEISERLPVSAHKAARWRNRFSDEGLAGIEKNLPRGGNHSPVCQPDPERVNVFWTLDPKITYICLLHG